MTSIQCPESSSRARQYFNGLVRLELARFLFWFMFGPSVHIADDAFGFLISDGVRRAYTSSARINSAFM